MMQAPDFSSLKVVEDIAPGDPMYHYGPELYFLAGPEALRCIWLAMLAAMLESPRSILDFGCGYGRVLRTLKAAFPDANLTACDLRENRVAFCASKFEATGVVSSDRPEEIELRGPFDLIWCGSHLTHIEKDRWTGFVRLFESVLAPGGVLVFTVYGPSRAEDLRTGANLLGLTPERAEIALRDYEQSGFGFGEGHAVGGGDCLVKPEWVCAQLEQTPDLALLLYLENGWLGQDVVACTKA
jgi:SAM-dependent methyltransferase